MAQLSGPNPKQQPSKGDKRPNGNLLMWVILGVIFMILMFQQEGGKYALKTKTLSYTI